jgi:hypothetical protein
MRGSWKTWLVVAAVIAGCSRAGTGGPPQTLHRFASNETPITRSGVTPTDGGWAVERAAAGSVPLFEFERGPLQQTTLTYRARLKAHDIQGQAYLEMWVRVPGRGEFFSRGLHQPLHGTSEWASYEIPFFLNEPGVRADLVKLNVAFEGGGGTVWIKDVELLQTPLG